MDQQQDLFEERVAICMEGDGMSEWLAMNFAARRLGFEDFADYEKQTKSNKIEVSSNQNIDISSPLSSEGFSFLENFIGKIQQ